MTLTAYQLGQTVRFKAVNPNTGASTVNVNGLGVINIVGGNNTALQGGEISSTGDGMTVLVYDGTNFRMIVSPGALQVAPATASGQAIQQAQVANTYPNGESSNTSGTTLTTTLSAFVAPSNGNLLLMAFVQNNANQISSTSLATNFGTIEVAGGSSAGYSGVEIGYLKLLEGDSAIVSCTTTVGTSAYLTQTLFIFFQPTP
jgi:hypothetical protein